MNWAAISAIGQLAGAIAVVVTVGYLAVQIRLARLAASDANRLQRGVGVREMIFNVLNNEQLRRATDKSERYDDTIRLVAQHLELSDDEASVGNVGLQCLVVDPLGSMGLDQDAKGRGGTAKLGFPLL